MIILTAMSAERTALPVTPGLVSIRESGSEPAKIVNRGWTAIQQMARLMAQQ